LDEKFAPFAESLDKFLAANGNNGYLVGDSWSAADILFYTYLKAIETAAGGKVPYNENAKKLIATVEAVPGVAAFVKDTKKNPTAEGFSM
jgi:glutathione S-transferase